MIIEIKDLPAGRRVKHINVDITFEEDGTPNVKSTSDDRRMSNNPEPDMPTIRTMQNLKPKQHNPVSPAKPDVPETREAKPIPQEMQDLEL